MKMTDMKAWVERVGEDEYVARTDPKFGTAFIVSDLDANPPRHKVDGLFAGDWYKDKPDKKGACHGRWDDNGWSEVTERRRSGERLLRLGLVCIPTNTPIKLVPSDYPTTCHRCDKPFESQETYSDIQK